MEAFCWTSGTWGAVESITTKSPQFHIASSVPSSLTMLTRRSSGRYGRTQFITAGYPERAYCIPRTFIRTVQTAGYQGPWGVEILSESFRKLPLTEMAQKSFEASRWSSFRNEGGQADRPAAISEHAPQFG